MSLTIGSWSKTELRGVKVWEATTTATTNENDAYSKIIDFIDPTRPWTLIVQIAATADGSTLPVDLWGGWESTGLAGDSTTVAWTTSDGCEVASAIIDDVKAVGTYVVRIVPNYTGTAVQGAAGVTGVKSVSPMPYYQINCDGGSTLNAVAFLFIVVQEA